MAYIPNVQYVEGDTDASITGTAVMWEDLADTLEPVSATKPMPVNVITGGGGGPVTVADGDDAAEGATTDAAVTSDTDGTVSGKLRGLVKILASVWDSLNGRLKVDASAVAVPVTDNAGSLTVDGTVAATQSGTWTVQPGNTANTTAWKVDASSVAVPVTDNSGSLTVDDGGGSLTVDGPLTDAQLRAAVVPIGDGGGSLTVDGTVAVTDGGGSLTVDGPLTDTELRATPVPVSGTVAATQSGTWTVQPGNTANTTAWKVDASSVAVPITDNAGSLTVDGSVSVSAVVTHTDRSTSGTIAALAGSVSLAAPGTSTAHICVTGTFVGSISVYLLDVTTLGPVSLANLDLGTTVSAITISGTYEVASAGAQTIFVSADSWTSGSATVAIRASAGAGPVHLDRALPAGTNSIGGVTNTETRPTSTTSVVDLLGATDATRVLTILAANTSRRGATIRNDTDTALIIREGGSASASNYTDILPAGARYTLDYPASTGILTAYLPQVPQGRLIATERS